MSMTNPTIDATAPIFSSQYLPIKGVPTNQTKIQKKNWNWIGMQVSSESKIIWGMYLYQKFRTDNYNMFQSWLILHCNQGNTKLFLYFLHFMQLSIG